MATKPTIALARWADQIGANLVSPSSGLRDLGFQSGTAALSGIVNTELNQLYQWALFLDEFFKTAGAAAGDIKLTGAASITGAVTLGSTLALTGVLNANGGVAVPTGQAVALNGTTTLTAGALITANGGVTAGANQNITVSGTGKYKHGSSTVSIPIQLPIANGGSSPDVNMGGTYVVPIVLPVGERILALRAVIKDVAATTIHVSLGKAVATASGGAYTIVGSSSNSAGSGATQTLSLSGLTETLIAGDVYAALIIYGTGVGTTHLYAMEVDYDCP